MVNYLKVVQGFVFFIIACFLAMIVYLVGTSMLDATTSTGDPAALDNGEQAVVWFGMILIWVMTLVILPAHYIIEGLKEQNN